MKPPKDFAQGELEALLARSRAAAERAMRQAERELGHDLRRAEHRQAALTGGGARERARRQHQRGQRIARWKRQLARVVLMQQQLRSRYPNL